MKMLKAAPKRIHQKQVFIVDDHPVFREGLVGLINQEPGWTVCGQAGAATQALSAIQRLKPDLVLADISLPGKNGLELVKDILAVCRDTAVLVISMHDETLYAERVLRAGGRGYIMKQEGPEGILQAIRHVLDGQVYLSRNMSVRILDSFSRRPQKPAPPMPGSPIVNLKSYN
jgi:DNA-binding NarL/FixJ family response regulator